MNRRGFLSAILATSIAPAIVRAESLMKIVVPKQEIFTFDVVGDYLNFPSTENDLLTIEGWIPESRFTSEYARYDSYGIVRKEGKIIRYKNGNRVPDTIVDPGFQLLMQTVIAKSLPTIGNHYLVDGVKVSTITKTESDIKFILPNDGNLIYPGPTKKTLL